MLIDEVESALPVQDRLDFRRQIAHATLVRIQNVADLYAETANEMVGFESFPNLAPPWSQFWMEYRLPRRLIQPMRANGLAGGLPHIGVLIEGTPCTELPPNIIETFRLEISAQTEWAMRLDAFVLSSASLARITLVMLIDAEGRAITRATDPTRNVLAFVYPTQLEAGARPTAMQMLFDPCLLAISICHARNVPLEAEEVPAQLRLRRQHDGKTPVLRFHTLKIEPVARPLRHAARSSTGLKMALHTCRAHFKTYTEERKLLGKHTGTFFWHEQVRGSLATGLVVKDYEISPPRAAEERQIEGEDPPPAASPDATPNT